MSVMFPFFLVTGDFALQPQLFRYDGDWLGSYIRQFPQDSGVHPIGYRGPNVYHIPWCMFRLLRRSRTRWQLWPQQGRIKICPVSLRAEWRLLLTRCLRQLENEYLQSVSIFNRIHNLKNEKKLLSAAWWHFAGGITQLFATNLFALSPLVNCS